MGKGAVLVQRSNRLERVIACASRSLTKAASSYSATEKEWLTITWATQKFCPYIYGRPFTVVSDHQALCWLATLKEPSGRLARWRLRLQELDANVTYKSGRKHSKADCLLSRARVDEPPKNDDVNDRFLGPISSITLAQQQHSDPGLKCIHEYLEGRTASPTVGNLILMCSQRYHGKEFCAQQDRLSHCRSQQL